MDKTLYVRRQQYGNATPREVNPAYRYQYDLNRESRELECDSLEEALELACRHLELAQACPKAIWRQEILVMNLSEIGNEWMQRQYSRLSHSKPDA